MKKLFLSFVVIFIGSIIISCGTPSATSSSTSLNDETIYKGILVKSGICKQRVIEIIGDMAGMTFEQTWTDESTNKTYKNVFSVKNICDFPDTINEGDTISFRKGKEIKQCAVCLAYTPVPETHIEIAVIN